MISPVRAVAFLGLAAVLHAPLAPALTLVDTQANGATVDTTFTTADTIAVDLMFPDTGPAGQLAVTLRFELDQDDIARGSARLNGIVSNLSPLALASLRLGADRATVTPGSLVSNDGPSVVTTPAAGAVHVAFTTPVVSFVELGDPLADGRQDWTVGFAGLAAGDSVALTWTVTSVPEPGTWVMMLGGLGLLGASLRRTRQASH